MLATNVEKWFESAEQRGEQRGRQEGRSGGMIEMFLNMLAMRFPNFDFQAYKDKISNAAEDQLNRYSAKLFTAKTPEEVFADDEKK
jgi:IS30 family transposase